MKIIITICRQAFMRTYHMPTGVGLVSACLKQAGHEVIVINPNHSLEKYETILEREIIKHKPQVIAAGGLSFQLNEIRVITDIARKLVPDAVVIIGGPLVTYTPEIAMVGVPSADYGIIGEGEYSTVELLKAIEAGSDIGNVKGIIYRSESAPHQLVQTAARPLIDNLDELPMADFEGLGLDIYAGLHRPGECAPGLVIDSNARVMPLLTSRGCPHRCTFCVHDNQRLRERSLNSVFSEIQYAINKYGINALFIYDDVFCLDRNRLIEFCQRIAPLGLRWTCSVTAKQINPEMLQLMKESGCCCISVGVESMSPTILKSMQKGATVELLEQAMSKVYAAKIALWSNLLFFDPAETLDTIDETLEWYNLHPQYDFRMANIGYHPGSKIYDDAVKKGLIGDPLKYLQSSFCELNGTIMSAEDFELAKKLIKRTVNTFGLAGKIVGKREDTGGILILSLMCPHCGSIGESTLSGLVEGIRCPSCNQVFHGPIVRYSKPSQVVANKIDKLFLSVEKELSDDKIYNILSRIISLNPYNSKAWIALLGHVKQMKNFHQYAIILRNLLIVDPYNVNNFYLMAEVLTSLGYKDRAKKYALKAEHLKKLNIVQADFVEVLTEKEGLGEKLKILELMLGMSNPIPDKLFSKVV